MSEAVPAPKARGRRGEYVLDCVGRVWALGDDGRYWNGGHPMTRAELSARYGIQESNPPSSEEKYCVGCTETRFVTVSLTQLRNLERAYEELAALEAHGVDNWEGYSDAMHCVDTKGCDVCE